MKTLLWVCKECGNEVMASTLPMSLKWDDGHRCDYELRLEPITLDDLPKQLVMQGYVDGKKTIATVTLMEYGGLFRVKRVVVLDDEGDSRMLDSADIEYEDMDSAITVYRLTITGLAKARYEAKGVGNAKSYAGTRHQNQHHQEKE